MIETGAEVQGSRASLIEANRKFGDVLRSANNIIKSSADSYCSGNITAGLLHERYERVKNELHLAITHMNVIMESIKTLRNEQKVTNDRLGYLENIKSGITNPAGRSPIKCGEKPN